MPEFTVAPCVEDELWEIWKFIAKNNLEAATRVVESAFQTFANLAITPALGRARIFRNPRLKGIRSWRVSGFDNYLILYRSMPEGIQVLHVYHSARDIETWLGEK